MKEGKKMWVLLAAALFVAGLFIFIGAMAVLKFDFTKLSTAQYETNTCEVGEAFDQIVIDVDTAGIEFVLSDHEQCEVVCFEREREKHSVAVKDGTLTIAMADTRKWYDYIGFTLGSPKITVYLPQAEYTALSIDTHTGDIKIPNDFRFGSLRICGSTAAVECLASVSNGTDITLSTGSIKISDVSAGELALSVTTGNIKLDSVACDGAIGASVTTGGAELTDVSCGSLTSHGTTGRITLKNVIASGQISIERTTGSIRFDGSDAAELYVRTSTGSVKGTLLSPKVFITETATGSIHVPKTVTGGRCEIKTATGDIQIDIP